MLLVISAPPTCYIYFFQSKAIRAVFMYNVCLTWLSVMDLVKTRYHHVRNSCVLVALRRGTGLAQLGSTTFTCAARVYYCFWQLRIKGGDYISGCFLLLKALITACTLRLCSPKTLCLANRSKLTASHASNHASNYQQTHCQPSN